MNALVAYDSSSGEEGDNEDVVSESVMNEQAVQVSGESVEKFESGSVIQPNDAVMVGPQIPSDVLQGYEEDENGDMLDGSTSERDMMRYLTQATHPMTEMPPSPPGSPNATVTDRIRHFLKLKSKATHFNEDLARKSAFKNPALLSTLMDRAGLDEQTAYRTSLPINVFDSKSFPAAGYKEALLKNQQVIRAKEEAEKRTLAATGKRTLEFAPASTSASLNTVSPSGSLQKRQKP